MLSTFRNAFVLLATAVLLKGGLISAYEINSYNADYGVFLGELTSGNSEIGGQVFLVNTTTLQIFNFTFDASQNAYFWFDVKETATPDGLKGLTYEYGISPIGSFPKTQDRIVVHIPEKHHIDDFKSFSVYDFKSERNFGSVIFPTNMKVPQSVALSSEFAGKRYKLLSGPVYVIDRRTIKVYAFTFQGDKAPKTFFYAGRGSAVAIDAGEKVAIRGKDIDEITEFSENYKGGKDLILELPENYDIFHIDWISVFCVKYRVSFGNIVVPTDDTLSNIPPYVPPFKKNMEVVNETPREVLKGSADRVNFTFQLAETNNIKPHKGFPYFRPPKYVWFVNSVQTPDLYLLRNVTYTFNIEGGRDKSISQFFNPLYIGNDEHGAYNELSPMEAEKVTVYSPGPIDQNSGPLCIWSQSKPHQNESDMFLECDGWPEDVHSFTFTPNDTTPSVLYYNSATNFDMGGLIHIVDELPTNVTDAHEIPFNREKWHTLALTRQHDGKVNTAKTTAAAFLLILVTIILS